MTLFRPARDAFGAACDALRDASRRTLAHVLVAIDPVLVSIGPLAVRWFGAAGAGRSRPGYLAQSARARSGGAGRKAGAGCARLGATRWACWWPGWSTCSASGTTTSPTPLRSGSSTSTGCRCGAGWPWAALVAATRLRQEHGRSAAHPGRGRAECRAGHRRRPPGRVSGWPRPGLPARCRGRPSTPTGWRRAPDFGVARHPAQLYDALVALGAVRADQAAAQLRARRRAAGDVPGGLRPRARSLSGRCAWTRRSCSGCRSSSCWPLAAWHLGVVTDCGRARERLRSTRPDFGAKGTREARATEDSLAA